MIAAVAMLRDRGCQLRLVLTGPYTERIRGVVGHGSVALGLEPADVIGTGYLPSDELERLIESASVLVSSSLYEAGCGPALEGWAKGRPVAMSNIPSFTEQMSEYGVHAELFDPHSPEDISRTLEGILRDPDSARSRADHSQRRMEQFTWRHAAQSYLSLFDRLLTGLPT
jgi:glycosyltransferase involved in cell wall biosynthesis